MIDMCDLCKRFLPYECIQTWQGTSGNVYDVCKWCYWRWERSPYCEHCCQFYKCLKQHRKTKKHLLYEELDDPVFLTSDQNIEFQRRLGSNMDWKQRKILAKNL